MEDFDNRTVDEKWELFQKKSQGTLSELAEIFTIYVGYEYQGDYGYILTWFFPEWIEDILNIKHEEHYLDVGEYEYPPGHPKCDDYFDLLIFDDIHYTLHNLKREFTNDIEKQKIIELLMQTVDPFCFSTYENNTSEDIQNFWNDFQLGSDIEKEEMLEPITYCTYDAKNGYALYWQFPHWLNYLLGLQENCTFYIFAGDYNFAPNDPNCDDYFELLILDNMNDVLQEIHNINTDDSYMTNKIVQIKEALSWQNSFGKFENVDCI